MQKFRNYAKSKGERQRFEQMEKLRQVGLVSLSSIHQEGTSKSVIQIKIVLKVSKTVEGLGAGIYILQKIRNYVKSKGERQRFEQMEKLRQVGLVSLSSIHQEGTSKSVIQIKIMLKSF